jgi:hypothetical protein
MRRLPAGGSGVLRFFEHVGFRSRLAVPRSETTDCRCRVLKVVAGHTAVGAGCIGKVGSESGVQIYNHENSIAMSTSEQRDDEMEEGGGSRTAFGRLRSRRSILKSRLRVACRII